MLLGVTSVYAAPGVALGAFDPALLTALPSRVVGLLEHELLQALPLYALIGALLNRLPLAGLMHAGGERLFGRSALTRALAPQLVAQALLIAAQVAWPALTHWGSEGAAAAAVPAASGEDADRLMEEAIRRQPGRTTDDRVAATGSKRKARTARDLDVVG